MPHAIDAFVSGAALTRSIEAAGLVPAGRREPFGFVSICSGVKGDPGGKLPRERDHGVTRLAPATRERPRQKWWVILAGTLVLGIVALQMIVALIESLSR